MTTDKTQMMDNLALGLGALLGLLRLVLDGSRRQRDTDDERVGLGHQRGAAGQRQLTGGGEWALTMNTVTLFAGFFVFAWIMVTAANAIALGPESDGHRRYLTKARLGQIVEGVVIALRDMFIKPQLGDKTNKFLPFLLTLFFFILFLLYSSLLIHFFFSISLLKSAASVSAELSMVLAH